MKNSTMNELENQYAFKFFLFVGGYLRKMQWLLLDMQCMQVFSKVVEENIVVV